MMMDADHHGQDFLPSLIHPHHPRKRIRMQRQRFQIDLLHYVMMPRPLQGVANPLPNFQRSFSLMYSCLRIENSLQRMLMLLNQSIPLLMMKKLHPAVPWQHFQQNQSIQEAYLGNAFP
jgi:hypothetical protein